MLSLERQNKYRERYRQIRLDWQTSGEIFESLVRRCIASETRNVSRAMRVLDVGCGEGGVIELFTEQLFSVGIDPYFTSLLGHRDEIIRLAAGRLENLPFRNAEFDLVVSSWVLEHLAKPEIAFAEITRVLKRNGHFVFITPNVHNIVSGMNRLVPRLMQSRLVRMLYGREEKDTFPTVYRANSEETLSRLAESAGLRRVKFELVSDPTYLAFNDLLFYLSVLVERFTPRRNFVHIVGDYVKE